MSLKYIFMIDPNERPVSITFEIEQICKLKSLYKFFIIQIGNYISHTKIISNYTGDTVG